MESLIRGNSTHFWISDVTRLRFILRKQWNKVCSSRSDGDVELLRFYRYSWKLNKLFGVRMIEQIDDGYVEDVEEAEEVVEELENGDQGKSEDDESEDDEEAMAYLKYKKNKSSKKREDYYALIGLGHIRHAATPAQIKRAYKKAAMKYHPDLRREEEYDDTLFKKLQVAYEVLSDPAKKKAYDSDVEFDDAIPENFFPTNDLKFYTTFGECFTRWAQWSEKTPVPVLGNAKTSFDNVEKFYRFWSKFKSWRDYSFEDEYDINEAHDREERRWMERKNKKKRLKKKTKETEKIKTLVQLAKKFDPRMIRRRELLAQEKKEKELKKQQEEQEKQRLKEERRKARLQKEEEKIQKELEEKRKVKEEEIRKETRRNELNDTFRDITSPYVVIGKSKSKDCIQGENVEILCAHLTLEQMEILVNSCNQHKDDVSKLCKLVRNVVRQWKQKKEEEALKLREKFSKEEEKRKKDKEKSKEWSTDELKRLTKATVLYKKGTKGLWEYISRYVGNDKSPNDCLMKAQELTRIGKPVKTATPEKKEDVAEEPRFVSVEDWTLEQQKMFEGGIRQFKKMKGDDKWKNISSLVLGKTAEQCKERYQWCKKMAKMKKGK